MEELTQREARFIEILAEGEEDRIKALKEAGFNFKSDQSARVYLNRLLKKPKVIQRLRIIRDKVDDRIADKTKSFLDLLLKHVSMEEIAKKLADNLRSNDKRVSDSALEKAMRVISAYPKEDLAALSDANFQIVMVKGAENIKTLAAKSEPPMIIQETNDD